MKKNQTKQTEVDHCWPSFISVFYITSCKRHWLKRVRPVFRLSGRIDPVAPPVVLLEAAVVSVGFGAQVARHRGGGLNVLLHVVPAPASLQLEQLVAGLTLETFIVTGKFDEAGI